VELGGAAQGLAGADAAGAFFDSPSSQLFDGSLVRGLRPRRARSVIRKDGESIKNHAQGYLSVIWVFNSIHFI
jgi:hypothetical protein